MAFVWCHSFNTIFAKVIPCDFDISAIFLVGNVNQKLRLIFSVDQLTTFYQLSILFLIIGIAKIHFVFRSVFLICQAHIIHILTPLLHIITIIG